MKILLWHVHGSWTTAFVCGSHEYTVPVLPDRGPDGRGRAQTWDWPASVREAAPAELRNMHFDAVILQRPHEFNVCREWLGLTPGIDIPAIYLEHNAPEGEIHAMLHPARDWGVPIVHVTHFNNVFWDCGDAQTQVIEHGVVDPGYRYTGEIDACAVVVNELRRRNRIVGADIFAYFRAALPVELFGMDAAAFGGHENLRQSVLHQEIARRRIYLHTPRWTSLGLSLIEAMHLGMPVVAFAATEIIEAVPAEAGIISTNVPALRGAAAELLRDPERAREMGRAARAYALERFGLARFLADWDSILEKTACVSLH